MIRLYSANLMAAVGRVLRCEVAAARRTTLPSVCRSPRVSRAFSTRDGSRNPPRDSDNDHTYVPQGPKDTLLMLGYSIKEDEMEAHVQALKETLKLKMMTLEYYTPDMAQSYTDLAMAQHQSVQFINEAKANYLNSFEIWRKIRGPESREVANVLCLIGVVLRDLGDIDAAKSAFEDSLEIDRKLNSIESKLSSVFALNNLAGIEHIKGNVGEAATLYEEAIRIMLTATGGDPNHRMIALFYYNLACSSAAAGDRSGAETALLRARDIVAEIGDVNHLTGRIEQLLKEVAMVRS